MGKKVFKALSKFGSSKIMDPLGLNKMGLVTPIENALAGEASPLDGLTGAAATRAAAQAAEQQAAIANQAAIVQANANALQANAAKDNTANVVSGGTADAAGTEGSDLLTRRRASTVSATLGI